MRFLVLVTIFLFYTYSNAESLEPTWALKRFQSLSVKKDSPTVFDGKSTISAYIDGRKFKHKYTLEPSHAKNQGWVSTHVTGYKNKNNKIRQISISSSLCNLGVNKEAITSEELQKLETYITKVGKELFQTEVIIDIKSKRNSLKNKLWIESKDKQIKKMRIMTGRDKCDGRGGSFYRFDFFI